MLARRALSLPLGSLPLAFTGGVTGSSGGGGGGGGGPALGSLPLAVAGGAGRRGSFGVGVAGGGGGGGERGGRRMLSLPVPLGIREVDEGVEALAVPVRAGLTVDVTYVPAFEAALQIVEFVRGLDGEGNVELCSGGGGGGVGCGEDEEEDDTTPVPVGRVEEEELAELM